MAKKSQTELMIEGIVAMGYAEAKSPSGKYRMFRKDSQNHLFVGKSGALRKSSTGKIGDAISITHMLAKQAYIYVGECMQTWVKPVPQEGIQEAFQFALRGAKR